MNYDKEISNNGKQFSSSVDFYWSEQYIEQLSLVYHHVF